MPKASRMHHADEFGRIGSSALSGTDAPMIGAAAAIVVDGLTERESGGTPPPPPVTVSAIAVGLVVLFLAGVVAVPLLGLLFQSLWPGGIADLMRGAGL
jgi:hypothetical protein